MNINIMSRQSAFDFFFEHAGCSYNPKKESAFAGRVRGATELARAEYVAWDQGYTFGWSIDPYRDSSEWYDEEPPWQVWDCIMVDEDGKIVQSLCFIDFGRDGSPWGDSYKRVVEAELALEQIS